VIVTGEKEKAPGCDYKYKTEKNFSECQTHHEPAPSDAEEAEVLGKY